MNSDYHSFRVVAVLAVRNEGQYIARVLQHLMQQDLLVCIIDNESTDETREIIETFPRSLIIHNQHLPYAGFFDWQSILVQKQQLASSLSANWFLHCDADEILEPPLGNETLKEAIYKADREGYSAINFEEFVFVPKSENESWEGRDYVRGMKHYYYFAPGPLRLIRGWKKTTSTVDLVSSGGHQARFPDRTVFPQSFALRHYIALSLDYFIEKYRNRQFSATELERGWHRNRANVDFHRLSLPALSRLKRHDIGQKWDVSDPWQKHFFDPVQNRHSKCEFEK